MNPLSLISAFIYAGAWAVASIEPALLGVTDASLERIIDKFITFGLALATAFFGYRIQRLAKENSEFVKDNNARLVQAELDREEIKSELAANQKRPKRSTDSL